MGVEAGCLEGVFCRLMEVVWGVQSGLRGEWTNMIIAIVEMGELKLWEMKEKCLGL